MWTRIHKRNLQKTEIKPFKKKGKDFDLSIRPKGTKLDIGTKPRFCTCLNRDWQKSLLEVNETRI